MELEEKSGALIRNTMEIRRASKKAGVHRKKQKVLSDTRKTRSSLGKVGGIEGNTRKSWRNTRKKGRTDFSKVHASIHVRNYAVNIAAEGMIPDVLLEYQDSPQTEETATVLGDCYIYLGMENDGRMQGCVQSGRRQEDLPILRPMFCI